MTFSQLEKFCVDPLECSGQDIGEGVRGLGGSTYFYSNGRIGLQGTLNDFQSVRKLLC